MGSTFKIDDGDVAEFCCTGGVAKWIKTPAHRNWLRFVGQLDSNPPIVISRADLKNLSLVGPAPTYPAGVYPRTTAANFA